MVLIGLSVSLLGCNLADDTLRGVIGDASSGGFAVPPTPTGWSFKIYRNGVTTNDSSPVISGSLSSDYDGYKAKVYSDAGCSDQLGSATIVSGAFEISDISLGTLASDTGTKSFYGLIESPSGETSACTDVSLSMDYYPGGQWMFRMISDISIDSKGRLYISDTSQDKKCLLSASPIDGTYSVVTGAGVGVGTPIGAIEDIAVTQDGRSI